MVSAAPQLTPSDPESVAAAYLTVREAAAMLGVAESTLRRTIKQASVGQSATYAECEYRGRALTVTRSAERQPWRVVFLDESMTDVSRAAVARVDARIADLRVAMLPVVQEPALEHTSERPWWKFWARA
jgi:transposase-like protein